MASSVGEKYFILGIFACLLVQLQHCGAQKQFSPLATAIGSAVIGKVSDLPLPPSGTSGLSPFIQPIHQDTTVHVYYPQSYYNELGDRFSYYAFVSIFIRCLEPTKNISVNANPEWNLKWAQVMQAFDDGKNDSLPVVDGFYFNPKDETLQINLVQDLQLNGTYELMILLWQVAIDEDDRFGIQAFNVSEGNTGDYEITVSLSGSPKAMSRFVPCFDNSVYKIPYKWRVGVFYGVYPAAIVMMNAPLIWAGHSCNADSTENNSEYDFDFPPMAIGATQLRIVPYSWYPENNPGPQPPETCF